MNRVSPSVLLAIDVGNTAIKLGRFPWPEFREPAEPTDVLRLKTHSPDFAALRQWLPQESTICVLASVQRQAAEQLLTWLRQSALTLVTHQLSLADFPLRVAVHSPERVGQDRLAAAVGALHVKSPERSAVVVDAGSAITVDAVSRDGVFLGGAILPGLQTAAAALAAATDQLPEIDPSSWNSAPPILGRSTEQAIHSGVFWGSIGAIREVVTRTKELLETQSAAACDVVLTGGHIAPVAEHLACQAVCRPHLVLTGIALAARHCLSPSAAR